VRAFEIWKSGTIAFSSHILTRVFGKRLIVHVALRFVKKAEVFTCTRS